MTNEEMLERTLTEKRHLNDNLTATQARCTELIQENRRLKKVELLFEIYRKLTDRLHAKQTSVGAPELLHEGNGQVSAVWSGKMGWIKLTGDYTLIQYSVDNEEISRKQDPPLFVLEKMISWASGGYGK